MLREGSGVLGSGEDVIVRDAVVGLSYSQRRCWRVLRT